MNKLTSEPRATVQTITWHSFLTFISRVAVSLVSIPTAIMVARQLGPEGKGMYSLAILLPQILAQLGSLGFDQAITYYASTLAEQKRVVASTSLVTALIQGGLIWAIAFLALYGMIQIAPDIQILQITITILPFLFLLKYANNILLGTHAIIAFAAVGIIQSVIQLGSTAIALYGFKSAVSGASWAWMSTVFLTSLASLLLTLSCVGLGRIDKKIRSRLFRFGSRSSLVSALDGLIQYNVEVYILALLGGTEIVGLYTVGKSLAALFYQLPSSIATVIMPQIAQRKGQLGIYQSTAKIIRTLILLSVLAFLGVLILGYPFTLILFGSNYGRSYHILLIIFPAVAALGAGRVIQSHFVGLGQPDLANNISLFTIITLISSTLVGGLCWNGWGGIIGVALSYWSFFILWMHHFIKTTNGTWRQVIPTWDDLYVFYNLLRQLSWPPFVKTAGKNNRQI